MIRNARAQRNMWVQIAVSALVVLLPPIGLGAAVYTLLPARDDSGVHRVATVAAAAVEARPSAFTGSALVPQPASSQPASSQPASAQPAAVAPGPLVTAPKPVPSAPPAFSLASARQEPVAKAPLKEPAGKEAGSKDANKDGAGKDAANKDSRDAAGKDAATKDSVSGKDTARLLGPVPVRVTVVVPPTAAASVPAPAVGAENDATGSTGAEPPRLAELPPPHTPMIEAPAAQLPAEEIPSAAPTATARKHVRFSYLRHLARHSGARAEARAEARAAGASVQSQQSFSLRNWLHNLGSSASPAPAQRTRLRTARRS
jgi:hypothetical protein